MRAPAMHVPMAQTLSRSLVRNILLVAALATVALPASAQDAKADAAVSKDVAAVKQALEAKFPGAPVTNVSKSPYFGLFEAQIDDRMVYTDTKVTYVFVGSVYDTATRTNLTEQRMKRGRSANDTVASIPSLVRIPPWLTRIYSCPRAPGTMKMSRDASMRVAIAYSTSAGSRMSMSSSTTMIISRSFSAPNDARIALRCRPSCCGPCFFT